MKKIIVFLLIIALLVPLCACKKTAGSFRIIENLGKKHYAAVYRTDDVIAPVIEAALGELSRNGQMAAISAKWLGKDLSTFPAINDSTELYAILEETPIRAISVGVDSDFYPLAYQEGGKYKGMCVDIANAISSLIGWEIRIQPMKEAELKSQLVSGNIDFALGFGTDTLNPDDFTIGEILMVSDMYIVSGANNGVKRMKQLKGERIGTVSDITVQTALKNNEDAIKYVTVASVYPNAEIALQYYDAGRCSALAVDGIELAVMNAHIRNY